MAENNKMTIDRLDLSVHYMYAIRSQTVEDINTELRLDQAASIPPQIQIVDFYPKLTELDLVLGVVPLATPWAYFFPPKRFREARRTPFTFRRVIPSMGSSEEDEGLYQLIAETHCKSPEEEKEKGALIRFLNRSDKLNSMLSFIISRIGQFIQG